jgi:hypothetical protein
LRAAARVVVAEGGEIVWAEYLGPAHGSNPLLDWPRLDSPRDHRY